MDNNSLVVLSSTSVVHVTARVAMKRNSAIDAAIRFCEIFNVSAVLLHFNQEILHINRFGLQIPEVTK